MELATPRGFWRALLDGFAGWLLGLPGERGTYTVTPVRIPLRDGVELAADLYLPVLPSDTAAVESIELAGPSGPSGSSGPERPEKSAGRAAPAGLLLVHGPYGRGLPSAVVEASVWAARGYAVLLVSCRGTAGSGGRRDPGRTEADDGQDVVLWMRAQREKDKGAWIVSPDGKTRDKLPFPDHIRVVDWSRDGKWFLLDRRRESDDPQDRRPVVVESVVD